MTAFESLARDMLVRNPAIRHEWRLVRDRWAGDRLDLVCDPGSSHEVWATIRDDTVVIGTGSGHDDFEDFGRGLSEPALAREALERLIAVLREHGHPEVMVE